MHDAARNSAGPRPDLLAGWRDLWNGDEDAAGRIFAPRIAIRFGDRAIGPEGDRVSTGCDLAQLITRFRAERPGLRSWVVEARTAEDWGCCGWDAELGDRRVGGIDTVGIAAHDQRRAAADRGADSGWLTRGDLIAECERIFECPGLQFRLLVRYTECVQVNGGANGRAGEDGWSCGDGGRGD